MVLRTCARERKRPLPNLPLPLAFPATSAMIVHDFFALKPSAVRTKIESWRRPHVLLPVPASSWRNSM
ncbi:hypothetical protein AK812_SmicGene49148 [Symbiodinium microadriaticum]|uniref:Uncharacterized protein n=1 Tax=Symbiodinium microadriaticum TaxID=2951 RepID=A0A1Q9E312_SYMMI|nr:hypothetical protein AK812_SmicGene49148 [Symbiodinium microadriaticum]